MKVYLLPTSGATVDARRPSGGNARPAMEGQKNTIN